MKKNLKIDIDSVYKGKKIQNKFIKIEIIVLVSLQLKLLEIKAFRLAAQTASLSNFG